MSRNIMFILIYHRHKLLDLIHSKDYTLTWSRFTYISISSTVFLMYLLHLDLLQTCLEVCLLSSSIFCRRSFCSRFIPFFRFDKTISSSPLRLRSRKTVLILYAPENWQRPTRYVGVLISLWLFLFAAQQNRIFLGWVKEVRTTKS
jgi:hypothetical protein